MVRIRLSRKGKKKKPFYRIIVVDIRKKRDIGTPIEELGTYNPITKELKLDKEKAGDWIKKGALPSETVKTLLKK